MACLGDVKGRDKVLNVLLDAISKKKRQRFRSEMKPGKRTSATHELTAFWVNTAVMVADATGKNVAVEMEVAREVAALTKTTATAAKAALRAWYGARGFGNWREALKAVREQQEARDLLDIHPNMKHVDEN